MACSGRGYVTIVGRKRLWSDHPERTDEHTRVGIELLGQLKKRECQTTNQTERSRIPRPNKLRHPEQGTLLQLTRYQATTNEFKRENLGESL